MRVAHDFVGQELEGYEAVKARVLGLVDHTDAAAAEFLDDAVVRDSLPNHPGSGWPSVASSYGWQLRPSMK